MMLAVLAMSAVAFQAPWFCHDLDCPVFTRKPDIRVDNTSLEVRTYQKGQLWASTVIANTGLTEAENEGFQKLFDYISGANVEGKKIKMTSPVRNFVQPAQGPFCATNFTISFYVPFAYQPAITPGATPPPKAKDASVELQTDVEEFTVAVYSFAGFTDHDEDVVNKAAVLEGLLAKSGVKYDTVNWFFSAYDPPFRLANRHNEIWIKIYID